MEKETFFMKENTYAAHFALTFKDLVTEGHFADVTLVSDDQTQIPAHKIVLSACSPVLKNLLLNNPHSHPLLCLRGVKQQELQSILQFMYFGEATIHQDSINMFRDVASYLEVELLRKEDETNNEFVNSEEEEGFATSDEGGFDATEAGFDTTEKPVDIFSIMHNQSRSISDTADEIPKSDIPEYKDTIEVMNTSESINCQDCESV